MDLSSLITSNRTVTAKNLSICNISGIGLTKQNNLNDVFNSD